MMEAIDLAEIKAAAEKAVKPLEWVHSGNADVCVDENDEAETPFGGYVITVDPFTYNPTAAYYVDGPNWFKGQYASVSEAKAAAEANYRARILSALDLDALLTELQQHRADPSSGKGEAVAWLIRTHKGREVCLMQSEAETRAKFVNDIVKSEVATVIPLYAHPTPKATAPVTEEQVEAACAAYAAAWPEHWSTGSEEHRHKLRAALEAAALASPAPAATVPEGWQRAAMDETIQRIGEQPFVSGELYDHIKGMPGRMTPDFSEVKIGRWLGWVQGAACTKGWLTLDDCKAINKAASEAPSPTNTTESDHG